MPREGSGGQLPAGILNPFEEINGASNALLASARESQGGHPVAVMGPQVSYWSPQILMEQDIHAPATSKGPPIDARGASFPGTNLYVQLGRGRDYAWSATSAGQDIIDTYAVKLCNPNGSQPTLASSHYEFNGQCRAFDVLTRTNSWIPTPADQTSRGLRETLTTLRTKLGVVVARARIQGKPYAYTKLRATYFHEVDPSAQGFADFNNPRKMRIAPGLHEGGERHLLHVQLVLRRRQAHRLLQLGGEPRAADERRPEPPNVRQKARSCGRTSTRTTQPQRSRRRRRILTSSTRAS